MPFWYLSLELKGMEEIIHGDRNSRSLKWTDDPETSLTTALYVPAFRVHPAVSLQFAETISRYTGCWNLEPGMPLSSQRFSVTVSVNDAARFLSSLIRRLASLPETSNSIEDTPIPVREIRIVYIPFRKQEKAWVQTRLKLVIPLSALIDPLDSVR